MQIEGLRPKAGIPGLYHHLPFYLDAERGLVVVSSSLISRYMNGRQLLRWSDAAICEQANARGVRLPDRHQVAPSR